MAERSIAAEVLNGLREARDHRAGKRTLRTFRVEASPLPGLTPEMIRSTREELEVSRAVFAHLLRVPVRTVEGWEQGRARPPDAAAALILMARKYPDTLDRLASLQDASARAGPDWPLPDEPMRQVVIYPGDDGFWVAECPSLLGCVSQGKTRLEAIANIKEAIEGYVASLEEDGLAVPEERFEAMVVAV